MLKIIGMKIISNKIEKKMNIDEESKLNADDKNVKLKIEKRWI